MKRITMLLIVTLILTASAYPAIWYVDKDGASGSEDGRSWSTAFITIQPAIDAASEDGGGEVWVAEGIYDEHRESIIDIDLRDLYENFVDTGSLVMRSGVDIYGGFAGTETQRSARDWNVHRTVIDGAAALSGEPADHVVLGADNARLDGFTITGGSARAVGPASRRLGGGMRNLRVSPQVANCTFRDNQAVGGGGAMANLFSQPVITDCVFSNNERGAMQNEHRQAVVVGCTFVGNIGGAIRNSFNGSAEIRNCVFRANRTTGRGGAISTDNGSVTVKSCVFEDNSADDGGAIGAVADYPEYWVRLKNCVFANNLAEERGGAVYIRGYPLEWGYSLRAKVTNCSFGGNEAGDSASGVWIEVAPVTIRNCVLWDEGEDEIVGGSTKVTYSAVRGGYRGEGNIDTDPRYFDVAGGDLRLRFGSPCIDAGTADGAPETDIQGWTRPVGDGIDMGAYESPDADVNDTGDVDATDVQLVTNAVLGLDVSPHTTDINFDGRTNAVDIQLVINTVLAV